MLDLNALHAFAAVAEKRSFVAAARALRLPRSTVSARVAALEAALDQPLFRRTTRQVVPTAEGMALLERVGVPLEQLVQSLQTGSDGVSGLVRITLPSEYPQEPIAQAIARVCRDHPAIEIEIVVTNRSVDLVGEAVDLAIRGGSPGPASLLATPLPPVRFAMVASPAYLARAGTPATLADLVDHNVMPLVGRERARLLGLPAAIERAALRSATGPRANSMTILLSLAQADQGLAIVPLHLARDALASGALIRVLLDWRDERVERAWLLSSPRAARRVLLLRTAILHHAMTGANGEDAGS